jgi:tetratricopeptide (TPR) repeat protein
MPLLIANGHDDNPARQKRDAVPPLFAGLQKTAEVEGLLKQAADELADDSFVYAFGSFREALTLSFRNQELEQRSRDAILFAAEKLTECHWRIAESLLQEFTPGPNTVWNKLQIRKREEIIRVTLEYSAITEPGQYLAPLRSRLSKLNKTYPGDAAVEGRLQVIDHLLTVRVAGERDKNLGKLKLFQDRLDHSENPETLRRFRVLTAPFVEPYIDDPAFIEILEEVRVLQASYQNATRLLSENQPRDSAEVCERALLARPSNTLFGELKEKAKSREWVARLIDSSVQRALELEREGRYEEALDEWESLRTIEPHYPGLDAEILNCAAHKARSEDTSLPEPLEVVELAHHPVSLQEDLPEKKTPADSLARLVAPRASSLPLGIRIAITEEAWNNLKTGLAATVALLLVVLVIASNSRP